MNVVSDTSPIVNLAWIDRLELLRALYGRITLPAQVATELAAIGPLPVVARGLEEGWLVVHDVQNQPLVSSLQRDLDAGEAAAIACAVELEADLLLMDERLGRHAAQALALNVLGLLGVLLHAKRRGLLDTVKPILDDLVARAGFWVSRDLYAEVLAAANETQR